MQCAVGRHPMHEKDMGVVCVGGGDSVHEPVFRYIFLNVSHCCQEVVVIPMQSWRVPRLAVGAHILRGVLGDTRHPPVLEYHASCFWKYLIISNRWPKCAKEKQHKQ